MARGIIGWSARFEDPVPLPRGRELLTLRDAARYIERLPAAEQALAPWHAAIEALILVAEGGGHTLLPRIAVMRALNRDRPPPTSEPRRKAAKAFKIIR